MSQRDSGYNRVAFDQYETPEWVTKALVPHLPPRVKTVWDPACGTGKMVSALEQCGLFATGSDIQDGFDFLKLNTGSTDAIITNPPYSLATEFIDHALDQTRKKKGVVAMLLRTDFDHAASRRRLFHLNVCFAKKVVLTKRIVWFEGAGKKAAPSFNHAWFIWDWRNRCRPRIAYDIQDAA